MDCALEKLKSSRDFSFQSISYGMLCADSGSSCADPDSSPRYSSLKPPQPGFNLALAGDPL